MPASEIFSTLVKWFNYSLDSMPIPDLRLSSSSERWARLITLDPRYFEQNYSEAQAAEITRKLEVAEQFAELQLLFRPRPRALQDLSDVALRFPFLGTHGSAASQ